MVQLSGRESRLELVHEITPFVEAAPTETTVDISKAITNTLTQRIIVFGFTLPF
tara:strand:+ start:11265 stop:11426 length:162 start_codon:yes stop_codon:yes gene_type:complete